MSRVDRTSGPAASEAGGPDPLPMDPLPQRERPLRKGVRWFRNLLEAMIPFVSSRRGDSSPPDSREM